MGKLFDALKQDILYEHGMNACPTLSAICLSGFGDRGIVFIADPVQREPGMAKRRLCIALEGSWVSWSKTLFEFFFLTKMRLGLSIPWFEKLGLQALGLKLVTPIAAEEAQV
ncbi:MAG: hypothetical protein ACO3EZ_06100 [Prochlorotrichaceae cyanobacterium]